MQPRPVPLADALEYLRQSSLLLHELTGRKLRGKDDELFFLMSACFETAASVCLLLREELENQAYMLMRSLLETLVNLHYLRVTDDLELERYLMHPYYKSYHSIARIKGYRTDADISEQEKKDSAEMRKLPVYRRALELFSDTKPC